MPNKEPKKLSYEEASYKLESIIEAMEDAGLVSEMNSNGNREVLAPNANAE